MIRVAPARFVAPQPLKLSFDEENRAHSLIWEGKGTEVTGSEAERVERLMQLNGPNGRVSTRVVAGELYVLNGRLFFQGVTGDRTAEGFSIEHLLDLGPFMP